jgi:hypothetical protein
MEAFLKKWTDTIYAPTRSKARWISIGELSEPQPKAAHAYWLAKRGDRLMPQPKDVDPTEIPKLLPYISLIDVVPGEPVEYFYRLEGEAVKAAIGFTRMGRKFSDLKDYLGAVYPRAVARLDAAVEAKAPLAQTSMLGGIGRAFYTIEVVFLPLSRDDEKVDRLMLCMGLLKQPGDH